MPKDEEFYNFTQPGFVSVWVGDFRSEDDFDDYLRKTFAQEFGFAIPVRAVREMWVEREPIEIEKLVQRFSRSKTFDSKVVEAANARGVREAACMLVIYNFNFRGHQLNSNSQIRFIGAVPYPGFR